MKISVFYDHIREAAEQSGKSMDEVFQKAASFGIKGIEIEDKVLMEEEEKIFKLLQDHDMEVSCIYGFFDYSHGNDLQRGFDLIDFADDHSIKKIMIIPGFLTDREWKIAFLRNRCVKKMITGLNILSKYAKDNGIQMVLEDFDDAPAYYKDAAGLKFFLAHVNGLKCAFDTGNFLYSEEDSFEVLPEFLGQIGHVHCKDRTFEVKKGETPKATVKGREMYSSPVGSGCIQMKEIVEKILASGYDDYFAIEHFGSSQQLQDIETSAAWLNQFKTGGCIDD